MPENRGNSVAATTARGHRPLPLRDTAPTIRATHQPQTPKPAGFNWDWNKATCAGCQTKVTKSALVDDRCPTCRGVVAPVQLIRAQKKSAPVASRKRQHSKGGDQVYEQYPDTDLAARYQAPATVPAEPEPTTAALVADAHALAAEIRTELARAAPVVAQNRPSPEVEKRQPPAVDLVQLQCQHATRVLTRSAETSDPLIGLLRNSVLSSLEALHLYLELHPPARPPQTPAAPVTPCTDAAGHTTTQPDITGLGGDQPAAATQGEGVRQPARSQTHQKSRRRAGRPRSNPSPETIADVVRRYLDDQQPLATIMADTGMGKILIRRILTDAGVPIRPSAARPTELSTTQQADAIDLYLQGGTLADVGRAFHVHARTVRALVRAAGHPIHSSTANGHTIGVRLRDLGTTSRQVKDWAVTEGILPAVARGSVAHAVIDAYETAHQPQQEGPAA